MHTWMTGMREREKRTAETAAVRNQTGWIRFPDHGMVRLRLKTLVSHYLPLKRTTYASELAFLSKSVDKHEKTKSISWYLNHSVLILVLVICTWPYRLGWLCGSASALYFPGKYGWCGTHLSKQTKEPRMVFSGMIVKSINWHLLSCLSKSEAHWYP